MEEALAPIGGLAGGGPSRPLCFAFLVVSNATLKGLSLKPNKGLFKFCLVLILLSGVLFWVLSRMA